MNSGTSWALHPQLARDTAPLGDLPLSRILISKDANFPWLILVPRRAGCVELIDLDSADQAALLTEIDRAARALKAATRCDKLNIAALGNVVPQLHVHVIGRRTNDAAWPKPAWGAAPPRAYDPADLDRLTTALREKILTA
jgi:diadenosine tetraphosphate (Ap4A) HIT family hydrolase